MNEKDKALIDELKKRFPSELISHIKRMIVFGSRARDEAKEDSDLDIFAIVDEKTDKIEKQLKDIAYQAMWDYNFKPIISLKIFSERQFDDALEKGFSFYKHIEKDGISI